MSTRDDYHDPVVAFDGRDDAAWLQAADVVVGRHRSRRRARRWVRHVRRAYPGCSVALSVAPTGRWCVVGFDHHLVVASIHSGRGHRTAPAAELGRGMFAAWVHWHRRARPAGSTEGS